MKTTFVILALFSVAAVHGASLRLREKKDVEHLLDQEDSSESSSELSFEQPESTLIDPNFVENVNEELDSESIEGSEDRPVGVVDKNVGAQATSGASAGSQGLGGSEAYSKAESSAQSLAGRRKGFGGAHSSAGASAGAQAFGGNSLANAKSQSNAQSGYLPMKGVFSSAQASSSATASANGRK